LPNSFFMPGHPQPLMVTTVPTYRQILLNRVYNSTDVVWSLDPATLKLIKWHWCVAWNLAAAPLIVVQRPVHARKRVVPSALRDYREYYQFLGPSCLCPLLQRVSEEPAFTEAAIYIPVFGRFAGEYVAECANSRCGYLGQSPPLTESSKRLQQTSAVTEGIPGGWHSSADVSTSR